MPKTEDEKTSLITKPSGPLQGEADKKHEALRWILICVTLCFLVTFGVMYIQAVEGWQVETSLYVIVQIVTTIGYGDFTVGSSHAKLFCAFYVMLMLVFGAFVFNHIIMVVSDRAMSATHRRLKALQAVSAARSGTPRQTDSRNSVYDELIVSSILAAMSIAFGTIFYGHYEECTCSYGHSFVEGCLEPRHWPLNGEHTVEECIASGGYTKTYVEAFYMSVITLTTVGFGDHTPRSKVGRIVGCLWMLLGVAFMAGWFGTLTKMFFEESSNKKMHVAEDITEGLFYDIDKDGSGALSRPEFIEFFLIKNKLVSQSDLDLINSQFDKLDVGGTGQLTFDMCNGHI